jgi:O-antigen ligase
MFEKTQKLIEYGLYLLVFLLPIQTRWIIRAGELNGGYWEYGTISLYATDILLIGLILVFAFEEFRAQKVMNYNHRVKPYWWIIAGLELIVFIFIFVANEKLISIYTYARFLLGIGLFWLIKGAHYERLKLILLFLFGIFFQAVLGIWQFLTQSSFASKWLGMAEHDPINLGVSVIETLSVDPSTSLGAGRWLRAYGGMDHPNIMGGLLVVGILLAIGILIKKRSTENKVLYYITFFFLQFFLFALFFTFSRGAWLGLIIGFLIMLMIAVYKKLLIVQKKLLILLIIISLPLFVLYSLNEELVKTRLITKTRLENKSNTERIASLNESITIIKDNLFFGTGIGNYTSAIYEKNNKELVFYYQPVHNVYLLVLAELGLIGLLLFLGLLQYLFNKTYQIIKTEKQEIYNIGLFFAMIIIFLFDHWWWSLHFGVFLYWFLFGLMLRENKT